MPLKLSKKDPAAKVEGKWFTFAGDVEFKVRPLLGTILRELSNAARTGRMVADPKSGRMVAQVDDEKYNELLTDYLLEDWRGVVDEAGAALPVTLENRKALLDMSAISDFVWERARALDILTEQVKN
jgi:hypothetical protein